MRIGLGIDTGGTYTDSVLLDMDTGNVLAHSKALTTHEDLAKGIGRSIEGLPSGGDISLVALSSTLATNSVVEGRSCRVGLILIGRELRDRTETAEYSYIDGEFDLRGNIYTPLDEVAAIAALERMKGRIDSLAIAGYLSARYPAHENRVRELAQGILDVPIICAHDLTSKLGFEQRVNTAAINAGLVPIIIDLIRSVRKSLCELGIDAPLMMVKGDGSVMNAETAVRRPIETIMSGPASSLNSAMRSSGIRDAIVVDIGGTTTDIGLVRGGFIHTLDDGAVIAGRRTRVHAADVSTFGIGGDSGFICDEGRLQLSAVRVIPICVAASKWPTIRSGITDPDERYIVSSHNHNLDRLSGADTELMRKVSDVPISLGSANVPGCDLEMLGSEGYIICIGLTPSDILAAEGRYTDYDHNASKEYVNKLSNDLGITIHELLDSAESMVIGRIAGSIREHIMRLQQDRSGFYEHELTVTDDSMGTGCGSFKNVPIVGIGAPVGAWLPKVCEELGRELILPKDYDVANAIGAISSSVTEYVELSIRASPMDFSEDPECRVYAGEDSFLFKGKEPALRFAIDTGSALAIERARQSGGVDISVDHRIDEIFMDVKGNGSRFFRGADLIFRAVGRPDIE